MSSTEDFFYMADMYLVNIQYICIFITTVVMVSFIFIAICYYYYIEKLMALLFVIVYLMSLIVNQFSYALFTVSDSHEMQKMFYTAVLDSKLLSVFILFMFTSTIYLKKRTRLRMASGALLVLSIGLIRLDIFPQVITGYYSVINILFLLYLGYEVYKEDESKSVLSLKLTGLYSGYFLVSQLLGIRFDYLLSFDWVIILVLIFTVTVFFLKRYRSIIQEKTDLYDKLIIDEQTGLSSKTYLMDQLEKSFKGCLLFMDVNQFKRVNDVYGHPKGDLLLKSFGQALKVYQTEGQIVARIGGDEFMMFTPLDSRNQMSIICKDLIAVFRGITQQLELNHVEGLGLSIGVSTLSGQNGLKAYSQADEAMYLAKRRGNNQCELFVN